MGMVTTKVYDIIPCICCEDDPDFGADSLHGMPVLRVNRNSTVWEAFCPSCGRSGCVPFRSAYMALKHWNNFQIYLRRDAVPRTVTGATEKK